MRLLLMTRPEFFIEEHQIINALFDEGLDTLHLRKPNTEPILSERLLSLIPANYRKNIVVHDHFYLKNEYGLKGIHLNNRTKDLPISYKGHISCSCHSVEEMTHSVTFCNCVFLSPIFNSISCNDFGTLFSPSLLQLLSRQKKITKKVMAMGGIGLENIPLLRNYGFGGVVVLGDIWNQFNIHKDHDYKKILNHFRKLRKVTL